MATTTASKRSVEEERDWTVPKAARTAGESYAIMKVGRSLADAPPTLSLAGQGMP
jgi:hypothetical protein